MMQNSVVPVNQGHMVRCSDCEEQGIRPTALFMVLGGQIIVKETHHGRRHVTIVPLAQLMALDKEGNSVLG